MPAEAQAPFELRGRNPDVLTCIANLSNDEVFTPPEFASRMLDKLAEAWAAHQNGANLWADKAVKFLDPCTKWAFSCARSPAALSMDWPATYRTLRSASITF